MSTIDTIPPEYYSIELNVPDQAAATALGRAIYTDLGVDPRCDQPQFHTGGMRGGAPFKLLFEVKTGTSKSKFNALTPAQIITMAGNLSPPITITAADITKQAVALPGMPSLATPEGTSGPPAPAAVATRTVTRNVTYPELLYQIQHILILLKV